VQLLSGHTCWSMGCKACGVIAAIGMIQTARA
jgi:hypothetical protein